MKNKIIPLQIEVATQWPDLTPKLTKKQFFALGFTQEDLEKGEKRFDIETRGPWGIISKLRGFVVESVRSEDKEKNYRGEYTHAYVFHGFRSLLKPVQTGYQIEGKVSINGKRVRAFTSSQLIYVDNKLVDIAILYPCM